MIPFIRICLPITGCLVLALQTHLLAVESAWVKTGVANRLIYVPDADGDRVPDFSMVGYGENRQPLPTEIPVVIHVDPIAGDNTQHIQNAINYAASLPLEANGFRGVVELGPGKFDVNGHLSISASGIILRGSGSGSNLATNTHVVSQNRTDSISSASTPVINIQGSSSGTTRGPQIEIVDKRVPVGAQSFRVASATGLSVGGKVEIFRPSTQAWIEELGMDQIPDGKEWSAGDRDLVWQRTITRIEGNRVFLDAPITTALDKQWGGGTIRTFSAPNVIRNVAVENLWGQSLDTREESNEDRTPSFIRFTHVDGGWVRDIETRHFSYASVYASQAAGTQHITVDNVTSLLPSGQVTGGRRYSFAMDAQMSLVMNSHADSGRHDFVTGSDVTGPIVFYQSTTSGTRADSGPHHRWGNGLLFDNIDVNGNAINVQNRWTSGSGHGWAGANVVVWNSEANSFIMQAPPTAKGWLVGSTGTINAGNCHLDGDPCAGYYDSHGTPVTTDGTGSLYEAQVDDAADPQVFHWNAPAGQWSDAAAWDEHLVPGAYKISRREYLWGDVDNYTLDPGRSNDDNAFIDPTWESIIIAESPAPIHGFDRADVSIHNAAFTILHQLDPNEQVIHGSLALSLKQTGGQVTDDFLQLFDDQSEHRLSFSSLGWDADVNSATPFVGVIDMGQYLNQLQSGQVNAWVSNNTAVDWALYSATVATPVAGPIRPTVFLDGGNLRLDEQAAPLAAFFNTGREDGELSIGQQGKITTDGDFTQSAGRTLALELGASSVTNSGYFDVGGTLRLDGTFKLALQGSYIPSAGETFLLCTSGDALIAGTLRVEVPTLPGDLSWQITFSETSILAEVLGTILVGDFNGDQLIDSSDWTLFKAGQGQVFDGLTSQQAYLLGDLDGDFDHDLFDFAAFRTAFENRNGAGSFRELLSVPEPSLPAMCISLAALLSRRATDLISRLGHPTRMTRMR